MYAQHKKIRGNKYILNSVYGEAVPPDELIKLKKRLRKEWCSVRQFNDSDKAGIAIYVYGDRVERIMHESTDAIALFEKFKEVDAALLYALHKLRVKDLKEITVSLGGWLAYSVTDQRRAVSWEKALVYQYYSLGDSQGKADEYLSWLKGQVNNYLPERYKLC